MILRLKLPHYEVGLARTGAVNTMAQLYLHKPGRKEQIHANWARAQRGTLTGQGPRWGGRTRVHTSELQWHDPEELAAAFEAELARGLTQTAQEKADLAIFNDLIDDVINH